MRSPELNNESNQKVLGIVAIVFILVVISACGTKMELPSSPASVSFGSGDTTYIHLAPDWTINNGIPLNEPCDIVVGPDGYVFVVDRGNERIAVFDRVGNSIETGWTDDLADLDGLEGIGSGDVIEAIGQDEKLNLFMVAGGPTVWYWNQYINEVGVESVLDYFVVLDTLELDTTNASFTEFVELETQTPDRYVIIDFIFSYDPDRIDSVYAPKVFYQDPNGLSKYRGVAGGPDETVYITDLTDRVSRLTLNYHNMVMLNNGFVAYTYYGDFERDIAVHGTGMGTTIDPAGIYVQVQGGQHYIYFSQTEPNFMVQKIREEGVGNFFSAFSANTDIMELERFSRPMDIWVAEQYLGSNWVFVADTDSNRVQVFNPVGDFLMYAGGRKTSIADPEIFDELVLPEGVAHFEGTLYVADTGNNRIVRYALSTDVENIPGL
ncbi:hypothetical protein CEE37_01810 [candidate division LCP-89 bacterium B3_LCP]|uniref:6-bladed beta-propeller n=1 Tax=candidate division LCP-89 bacterium B3_LCP TaxID=2012998 RepID=A0A532V5N4_UNCL8|nr:MAG: hypothetical protein CEE37_01810 [candidate division LCP-89 bacterium B3_LCP]